MTSSSIPARAGLALAVLMVSSLPARANVYPSSLSLVSDVTIPGTCATPLAKISYILNETADGNGVEPGVKIEVLDAGNTAVRTVTIARQKKGKQTFLWDGRNDAGARVANGVYRVRITAADFGHNAWVQISNDSTNQTTQFNAPRGVAVNTNPASTQYGRIYVANAQTGAATGGRDLSAGDGLFALNADQSDAVGQGNTARTGGIDWAAGGNVSPWRLAVGPDNSLYISDWSDPHGGVYRMDGDLGEASGEVVLSGVGDTANPAVHGSITGTPTVTGRLADGNLSLYVVDEDLVPVTSYWKWAINGGPLPHNAAPTLVNDVLITVLSVYSDNEIGPDGKHYLMQNRSAGNEAGLYVVSPDGTTVLWDSLTTTRQITGNPLETDILKHSRGIAVSPDGSRIAVTTDEGTTWAMSMVGGIPDLANAVNVPTGTIGFGRDVAWDTAGNLYVVISGNQVLRIWSPPTGPHSFATTSQDYSLNRTGSGGPTINTQPTDQTVCPGDNATFSVAAAGSNLTYQWIRDGVEIPGAALDSVTLNAVTAADDGSVITAVICDDNGVAVSVPVLLNVGPSIIQQPANQTACVDTGQAVFTVSARGVGTLSYQWKKGGVDLVDGPGVAGATTDTLTLSNLVAGDNDAQITVAVTDDCGAPAAVTSSAANLRVSTGPSVTACCGVTIPAGTADIRFDGNVTSTVGATTYQWQINGVDAPADNQAAACGAIVTGGTTTSLHLLNVPFACNGVTLHITATDECGQNTSADLTVTVTAPPSETNLCDNQLDDDGDGFTDCADTDCTADPACACNAPWADAQGNGGVGSGNGDGDVDLEDFAVFQLCYKPSQAIEVGTYCHCFDRDTSGDVDADDFEAFQLCAAPGSKGANVPGSCP